MYILNKVKANTTHSLGRGQRKNAIIQKSCTHLHAPHSGTVVRAVVLVLLIIIQTIKKNPEVTDNVKIQGQVAEIEYNLSEHVHKFPIIIFV